MMLHTANGTRVEFTPDLAERLAFADAAFGEVFGRLFDAYIGAAGIDAPADDGPPPDDFTPPGVTELDLDRAGVRSILGQPVTARITDAFARRSTGSRAAAWSSTSAADSSKIATAPTVRGDTMSSKNKSRKSDKEPKPSASAEKAVRDEELSEEQLDDVTGGADVTGDRFKNCCVGAVELGDQQLSLDVESSALGTPLTLNK